MRRRLCAVGSIQLGWGTNGRVSRLSDFSVCLPTCLGVVLLAACSTQAPSAQNPSPIAAQQAQSPKPIIVQLPGGGTTLFPRTRVIAFYGAAGTGALGVLGAGAPNAVASRLVAQAHAYAQFERPVIPAMELIATEATSDAGASGFGSLREDDATIQRYIDAARRIHGITILDIQPGTRSFVTEAAHYDHFLEQPDVELALDAEWQRQPGAPAGYSIGHTTASVVNAVSAHLAALVARRHLPQKLLILHRFTGYMIADANTVKPRPGLAIVFHADGFGTRALKITTYRLLHRKAPFYNGFKLFYKQDTDMMPPSAVMRLSPQADLLTYE